MQEAKEGKTNESGESEIGKLLSAAGEALWFVLIQRELCGFLRHREFLDHMNVPKEVLLRAGPQT